MKELSIFVDESGDFGPVSNHSPFYLFTLVFHDQNNSITESIPRLDEQIQNIGFPIHAIHTGPIIRNENFYKSYSFDERKRLFNSLLFFTSKVDIKYHTIFADKRIHSNKKDLINYLSKSFANFVRDNWEWLNSFDKIIVYYDYGQSEITTILTSVLNSLLYEVEFRHVQPNEYKLFQVADMICTLELSSHNYDSNKISKSEQNFYHSKKEFNKFYYKTIKKKQI